MQEDTPLASANAEVTAQTHEHQHRRATALFTHEPRLHQPRNVNMLHEAEKKAEGVNTSIAINLTKTVGTMWTAYSFVALAFIGLFAILGWFPAIVATLIAWVSQTLI